MADASDRLLTCQQAAAYLALDPKVLRRMALRRELAVVRRGEKGRVKFRLSELDKWIRRNTIPARRQREVDH